MYCNIYPFFGPVKTKLVRFGEDSKLKKGEHNFLNVYTEMLLQISRDYSTLPDIRTMSITEIRFFYDGLRGEIKAHTMPKRS